MLCGLPEHAVRSDPVSERVTACCLQYHEHKSRQTNRPLQVYGLFILLGGLCSGIIKLSDVEVTGNLLLDLMPVMFIPAAVGIIDKIEELKAVMIPMLIITFVTTFIVMSITGVTAEWIIKRQKKGEK